MYYIARSGFTSGRVDVPPSKSHSIRALIIALLAQGESRIQNILLSDDVYSCMACCRALGAEIELVGGDALVRGNGGRIRTPSRLDAGNSGTSLYFLTAVAALGRGVVHFDGDSSLRKRSAQELLMALSALGAECNSAGGHLPYTVRGVVRGGAATLACSVSQYLSALLLVLPLAEKKTTLEITLLNEIPYVAMTLQWMSRQGIMVSCSDNYRSITIDPGQHYTPFRASIPGDASSATFWLCAAAVAGNVTCYGIDPDDTQADIEVSKILSAMGATVEWGRDDTGRTYLLVEASVLNGGRFDLNSMPDSLPALMATACYAREAVQFVNIAHARLKETDRIALMSGELRKMGGRIETSDDTVTVHPELAGRGLHGAHVDSHGDHRIAMALSIAALHAKGESRIERSECVAVTYPDFFTHLEQLRHS